MSISRMNSLITHLRDLDPAAYAVHDSKSDTFLYPSDLSLEHSISGTRYPLYTVDIEALGVITAQAEAWRIITEHPAVREAFLSYDGKSGIEAVLDLLDNA